MCRNCCKKFQVLEKLGAHDCYHISLPQKLLCWQASLVSMSVDVRVQNLTLTKGVPGRTTDNGIGKQSQAGLSLLRDTDASTRGFCEILSKVLVAQERSLSFTYGRPVESCSSLMQMYFGKRRASRINLFWSH